MATKYQSNATADSIRDPAILAAMKNKKWTSSSDTEKSKIIDNEIMKLIAKQRANEDSVAFMLSKKTPEETAFITTPISEYWEYEKKIAALNSDLLAQSKKYDELVAQNKEYGDQIINLSDAKNMMQSAVDKQVWAINKSADMSTKATALNKAIQIGWAQWTAGMQWATAGQLNKAQNEIANQFAPKFADIEAQRQAWLGTAAQMEQGIPTAMADIAYKNMQNKYNASLIWSQYGKTNRGWVINVTPSAEQRYNPATQRYENISTKPKSTTTTKKTPVLPKYLPFGFMWANIWNTQWINI